MSKKSRNIAITDFEGCQIPCISKFEAAVADYPGQTIFVTIKRSLAYPWNSYVKMWLKKLYHFSAGITGDSARKEAVNAFTHESSLKEGDRVRVRSEEEIRSTLDPFSELKGCAFLPEMHQYCGTEQRVFKAMQRFMDERDYKLKKTRGLILLENNFCKGTPVFGRCDRSCFLFWREEWLERLEG
jgi:hypothetical protein